MLATEGTIRGGAYERAIAARRPALKVTGLACPLFVALAEEGWTDGEIPRAVAQRYLDMRERLIPSGLDLREVTLDPRGAWRMVLSNGIEIRLGRREIDARATLFVDVAADLISSREAEIDFVDMRYSNGFTIGWKDGERSPVSESKATEGGMVAGLSN